MEREDLIAKVKEFSKKGEVGLVLDLGGDKEGVLVRKIKRLSITCENLEGDTFYVGGSIGIPEEKVVKIIPLKKGTKKRKIFKTTRYKKPKTSQNHVGVELEIVSTLAKGELEMLLANAGLEDYATVQEDGSISPTADHPITHEICILAGEKNIAKVVKRVCEVISPYSGVNTSCGLHVHLDMRNRNINKSYANLFASQPLLYTMCPESRIKGDYCIPSTEYVDYDSKEIHFDYDRYVGINCAAVEKHGTLEVRIHSGSLDPTKINNWIKLLIKIVDKRTKQLYNVKMWNNFSDAKKSIRLSGRLERYVVSRISKFKKSHQKLEFSDFVNSA